MATLTTQQITRTGVAVTMAAAAGGGDKFVPGKDTTLRIRNGGGSPITATVATPGEAFAGAAIADTAIVVAAGAEVTAGPFPYQHYRDPRDGLAAVTYSGVTSVTIAVLELQEG